jgi:hypothetical protein
VLAFGERARGASAVLTRAGVRWAWPSWVEVGAGEHPVRRGHVVGRPPATRVAHGFRAGREGLTYLAYGTREPNDICFYRPPGRSRSAASA